MNNGGITGTALTIGSMPPIRRERSMRALSRFHGDGDNAESDATKEGVSGAPAATGAASLASRKASMKSFRAGGPAHPSFRRLPSNAKLKGKNV
ncbi:hypothetical protein STCU_11860 [Strigomonas culicis]|uniref:Uncharacterized protein n=1 Tax=Strigomonas culicis TaxID=28005 RepID=S9TFF9_9TRYP|nr:hypothetical protein STCU_11860 [Strigomonas culicis]|eukprot:EPY15654.1 hypothetical protein STCU_11860 [Strigomonas culicis]